MKIIVKEKQFNNIIKESMFFDSPYIDKICNIMIKETQFGFGGMGLTPYLLSPWDNINKLFLRKRHTSNFKAIHLKDGMFRRDPNPNFMIWAKDFYGLSEVESNDLWKKYSKIAIEMVSDFLNRFGDDSWYGLERQIPDVSGFNKNYL